MEYCNKCGNKLTEKECLNCGISEGMVAYCENCDEFKFPMYNVAVSAVICNPDFSKILLIQQYGRPKNILVAGYVNKGENLEHALIREIKEEVGLDVIDFKFNASSYYEKSNTLICNFIVRAKNENYSLTTEVDAAHWFTIEKSKEAIYKGSLAEKFYNLAIEKIQSCYN